MRMLCLCWTDGYCPSDVATLAMKIRRRKTDVQRHLPALLTLFQKTEDGRLVYEELEQQRRRCVEISAVRRGAANAKWEYQRSSALPLQSSDANASAHADPNAHATVTHPDADADVDADPNPESESKTDAEVDETRRSPEQVAVASRSLVSVKKGTDAQKYPRLHQRSTRCLLLTRKGRRTGNSQVSGHRRRILPPKKLLNCGSTHLRRGTMPQPFRPRLRRIGRDICLQPVVEIGRSSW